MANLGISPQKKALVYTRNFTNRLIHWIIFFAMIVLMVTGFYIGQPTGVYGYGEPYEEFSMAYIRLIHFYGAMTLTTTLIIWVYLAFMSNHHRYWKELVPRKSTLNGAWEILKCYFTFEKPPFYRYADPFDGMLFLLLVILMALQAFTGFQLYIQALPADYWWAQFLHVFTDWTVWIFGSLQNVRVAHHLMLWIGLAGIIVHIYLQVAKTILWRDGHIGQIIGGYKYRDVK